MPTTIFELMSGLAREHGAINLGQGFPDDSGPEAVRRRGGRRGDERLQPVSADGRACRSCAQAVARHYARTQGLDLDWASEVTITSGATEALAAPSSP